MITPKSIKARGLKPGQSFRNLLEQSRVPEKLYFGGFFNEETVP
jgi:hypothetical protein